MSPFEDARARRLARLIYAVGQLDQHEKTQTYPYTEEWKMINLHLRNEVLIAGRGYAHAVKES